MLEKFEEKNCVENEPKTVPEILWQTPGINL